jgi:hypothetical protein
LHYQKSELDPKFAMTYHAMAVAYSNLNEIGRAAENARTAYDLRKKVSERPSPASAHRIIRHADRFSAGREATYSSE